MRQKIERISKPSLCVLFGAPRSGTTMLRLMIDAHPRFACPGESDFLFTHLVTSPTGELVYDVEALAANRNFRASGVRLPATNEAKPALASMIDDLRCSSTQCLVLALHRGIEELLQFEPNVPVLHLLRDPRDVARSAINMGWAGNAYYGARTWLRTENEWERVKGQVSTDQVLELKYEALVQDPESALSSICLFWQDEYHPAMLDYSTGSTYNSPDASLIEQWRRKATPKELGLIEPLFGDLLIQRGYKPSGYPRIRPALLQKLYLKLEHSFSVWIRRVQRYGLRDPLIVFMCRKLGFPSLSRSAKMRMDVVRKHYLK